MRPLIVIGLLALAAACGSKTPTETGAGFSFSGTVADASPTILTVHVATTQNVQAVIRRCASNVSDMVVRTDPSTKFTPSRPADLIGRRVIVEGGFRGCVLDATSVTVGSVPSPSG